MNLQVIEHQNQRVLTTAQLAESYGTDNRRISENFNSNKSRYEPTKHFVLLEGDDLNQFGEQYANSVSVSRVRMLYLWTEKGAWLHAKSLNTDEAWDAYEMLVDDYYDIKEHGVDLSMLSPELRTLISIEQRQTGHDKRMFDIERGQDSIKEVLSLNPTEWRKKVNAIINKIAHARGGYEAYQDVRNESYEYLENRAKCQLSIRLTNRQRKMALEGASKSRIDKTNKMDVIADDARLTEIYLAVVKEMAIKYGVDMARMVDKGVRTRVTS